jgi:hypothetical protein
MTQQAVESVIGRAVLDRGFLESWFADPDSALDAYELSEEEVTVLKTVDSETMEFLSGALDAHISKAIIAAGFAGTGVGSWVDPQFPGARPATGPQPM